MIRDSHAYTTASSVITHCSPFRAQGLRQMLCSRMAHLAVMRGMALSLLTPTLWTTLSDDTMPCGTGTCLVSARLLRLNCSFWLLDVTQMLWAGSIIVQCLIRYFNILYVLSDCVGF